MCVTLRRLGLGLPERDRRPNEPRGDRSTPSNRTPVAGGRHLRYGPRTASCAAKEGRGGRSPATTPLLCRRTGVAGREFTYEMNCPYLLDMQGDTFGSSFGRLQNALTTNNAET